MTSMIIGLYGVFLMLCALHGNGGPLLTELAKETSFVPWIVALLVLAALNSMQSTHDFVAPFLTLAIVTTIVTHWEDKGGVPGVRTQFLDSYRFMTGGK